MRRSMKLVAVLAALAAAAGSPSISVAAQEAPTVAGPASIIGAPAEGKGQVVFFRPSKLMGAAISYKVREGEQALGTLSIGRYFVTQVEPGAHLYTVHSESKDELRMEVEAGETYYVTSGMTMGVALYRPNLAPSDKAAFEAISGKLKLAKAEASEPAAK